MKARVLRSTSISMAAPRSLLIDTSRFFIDEDNGEDSPTTKKPIGAKVEGKFAVNRWEFVAAFGVFIVFSIGLFCIYVTMPAAELGNLKLPTTIADLRLLK